MILEKLYLGNNINSLVEKATELSSELTSNFKADSDMSLFTDEAVVFKSIKTLDNEDVIQIQIKHKPQNFTWQFHFEFDNKKSEPLKQLKGLSIYEINKGRPKNLIAKVNANHSENMWFNRKDSRHTNLHQAGEGFTQKLFLKGAYFSTLQNLKTQVNQSELKLPIHQKKQK